MEYAIKHSECDRFVIKHFKHSAGGYWFEGDYEALQCELLNLEVGE